jgi:uncharacterized membrane protein
MLFCTNCGTKVLDSDRFCPRCGTAQRPGAALAAGTQQPETGAPQAAGPPPPPPPVTPPPTRATMRPSTAATLCYIPFVGWIAAIVFLMLDAYRTDRYVRFHAFQGLYLAVLWFIAEKVFFPLDFHPHHEFALPFLPFWGLRRVIEIFVLIAQIMGIVKTRRNEDYRLPVLGELAEKSMA